MRRLLMCPPDYYRVDYEINPWMNVLRQPHADTAQFQWQQLKSVIDPIARVQVIEPVSGLPDMVFTANAGFVLNGVVLPSRFHFEERSAEEKHFGNWFLRNGFDVRPLLPGSRFEGEGDALFDKDNHCIWLGHGFRSDPAVAGQLHSIFGCEVVALKLADPHFYHLDTCFCPLRGGSVMCYPPALSAESQMLLQQLLPKSKRIEVEKKDACDFACNAIALESTLVLNRASESLKERLLQSGFSTVECRVDQFIRAGGAAKCLALFLDNC